MCFQQEQSTNVFPWAYQKESFSLKVSSSLANWILENMHFGRNIRKVLYQKAQCSSYHNMSDKSSDVICYCRKIIPNENTVVCNNPKCSFTKFHYSCLKISGSLPDLWYCSSCHLLSKFQKSKNLQRQKKLSIMIFKTNHIFHLSWNTCLWVLWFMVPFKMYCADVYSGIVLTKTLANGLSRKRG